MDIATLREILEIAEHNSFEKAADALYITQSSLSKHIKKAEIELGLSLFERSARKTTLSKAGETLLPYARQIVDLEEQYQQALRAYSVSAQYTLNIGSVKDLAAYQISDVFAQFQQRFATVRLNVACHPPAFVHQDLINGTLDLAFFRYSPGDDVDNLTVIPFTDDQLVVGCPKDHPLARQESVELAALQNERLIGFEENTFMYSFMHNSCRDAGFLPRISIVAQRMENQIELASRGMGLCLVMKKVAKHTRTTDIAFVNIEPPCKCRVDLCYLRGRRLSPAAQKFLQFIETWKEARRAEDLTGPIA